MKTFKILKRKFKCYTIYPERFSSIFDIDIKKRLFSLQKFSLKLLSAFYTLFMIEHPLNQSVYKVKDCLIKLLKEYNKFINL